MRFVRMDKVISFTLLGGTGLISHDGSLKRAIRYKGRFIKMGNQINNCYNL